MVKKSGAAYVFMCICLICILVTGLYFSDTEGNTGYTLKEASGGLVVMSGNGEIIESIEDTNLSVLPPEDRTRLQQGITVFTREELISLIEDFLC